MQSKVETTKTSPWNHGQIKPISYTRFSNMPFKENVSFTSNLNSPGQKRRKKKKKKRRGRSKWNAEVQKADSPPIPLIPPIRLCHTQGQGVWGRLAGGQAVKALHSLTWATIQRVTHPLPEESLIQSRSLQVLLIIKYTHAEQELYFKVRLSSGGGG